jgi:polyhydroxybutyrate depolymerase
MKTFIIAISVLTLTLFYQNCSEYKSGSNLTAENAGNGVLEPSVPEPLPSSDESSSNNNLSYPAVGTPTVVLTVNGLQRRANIYTPVGIDLAKATVPMLFVLHGGGGTAESSPQSSNFQYNTLADSQKIVIVYPEGTLEDDPTTEKAYWNDGRGKVEYKGQRENVDDISFLKTLMVNISNTYNGIDSKRIYLLGASNGGLMSQRLVCELQGVVAAYGSNIGSLAVNLENVCHSSPRPLIVMNGTEDPFMVYNGGPGKWGDGEDVIPPVEVIELWKTKFGCNSSPSQVTVYPNKVTKDNSTVEKQTFSCPKNPFVFVKVIGGGHSLPAGNLITNYNNPVTGYTNGDVLGAEIFWGFLKEHRLP